jgi:hypothetical protein
MSSQNLPGRDRSKNLKNRATAQFSFAHVEISHWVPAIIRKVLRLHLPDLTADRRAGVQAAGCIRPMVFAFTPDCGSEDGEGGR